MPEVVYSEETLRTQDGTELFCRVWLPVGPSGANSTGADAGDGTAAVATRGATATATAAPAADVAGRARAVVVICHGQGDHSGRHTHVARFFAERGYAVYAYDHRGQGRSGGTRGHVDRFARYYDDLWLVIRTAKERHSGLRMFVIGQSLGGLIALGYAARRPTTITGVVVSSPGFIYLEKVPLWKKALAPVVSWIAPCMAFETGIQAEHISRDPAVVAAYKADKIRYPKVTARYYVEWDRATRAVFEGSKSLAVPCLFMPAGADQIISAQATVDFYNNDPHPDKKLVVWEGLYHDIFNEPEKEKVLETAAAWIAERDGR
ncbi:MAG: Phospholipase YtpA [Firmicutes bacterium ADurb.BinA052]|nr:MAG: Phospholipase YtpA [Firmicutes bacterium ADurb.BinA052]